MGFKIICMLLMGTVLINAMTDEGLHDSDHVAEQQVTPTVEQLVFILEEKTQYTYTLADDGATLLFKSGQNELLLDYSAFDKQKVVTGLFRAVQNFDPSIVYSKVYPEAIEGYSRDSGPLADRTVLHLFVSETNPDERLDISISYDDQGNRNFFYYMLAHAPQKILGEG